MNMQDIDRGTDVLKVAAVFGTIAAAIGVVVALVLSGFAWWIALVAAGGMVWAEVVCWTLVFRQREAAKQRMVLAQLEGEELESEDPAA